MQEGAAVDPGDQARPKEGLAAFGGGQGDGVVKGERGSRSWKLESQLAMRAWNGDPFLGV